MQDLDLSVQSILLVGGLPRGLVRFKARLDAAGKSLLLANTSAAAVRVALQQNPSLAIITESLGRQVVVDLLSQLRASSRAIPAVVLSDEPLTEWTVRYVKAGAMDCLTGPSDESYVGGLDRCLEAILSGPGRGRFFCDDCPPGVAFVGRSPAAQRLLQTVRMVAFSRCNPVLILGETGVGKELVAKALHCWRSGEQAPMVAVNCAALTATLMESELFGHVKGAFTGADRDKPGLFEVAGGGSIFLDEISEMPAELQGKLLRVLQERTFRRVGGTSDIACSATVIAASNRELLNEAKQGRFRQDLYYRLAVFPIHVEPLKSDQRRDDITLLAEYFVENSSLRAGSQIEGISPEALQRLLAHTWPANVRELRNVIERATLLERTTHITPESVVFDEPGAAGMPPAAGMPHGQVPAEQAAEAAASAEAATPPDFSLETAEREFIRRALKETGWQRTKAAELLGITRATLHAKIKRYGIEAQ